jgi:hypothetical protein
MPAASSRGGRSLSAPLSLGACGYAPKVVSEGEPAPDFTATTDAGARVTLSHFRGKPVVLYFYPKDDSHATIYSKPRRRGMFRSTDVGAGGLAGDDDVDRQRCPGIAELELELVRTFLGCVEAECDWHRDAG